MISLVGNLKNYDVFISGANGFLGKELTRALKDMGIESIAVDRSLQFSSPVRPGKNKKVLFHMAGLSCSSKGDKDAFEVFESNVSNTVRTLFFCEREGIHFFVFPSTGLVYGDHLDCPANENAAVLPHSVYVASKLASETLIHAYSRKLAIRALIVRLGNVYGPGISPESVIGTLCNQVIRGSDIVLRDLAPVRDFIFSKDVVQGLLHLLDTIDTHSEPIVNLSTGEGVSIRKVAETVCRLAGIPFERIRSTAGSTGGGSRLVLEIGLLKKITGWSPQYRLQDGLKELVNNGIR